MLVFIVILIVILGILVYRKKTGNYFENCPKEGCTLNPRQMSTTLPLCDNIKQELDKFKCKINDKDGYNLNDNICCELYPNIKLERVDGKLIVTRTDCSGINQCYISTPVEGLQPCVKSPEPDFSYYNKVIKPQEAGETYDQLAQICSSQGKSVCLSSDICNSQSQVIDPKANVFSDKDNWIAVGDNPNGWLTLNPSRLCKTHIQVAGQNPDWGNKSDPTNFFRAVKCCDKKPDAKKTWQEFLQVMKEKGTPFNLRAASVSNSYLGVVYYKSGWSDYLLGEQVITEGDLPVFNMDANGLKLKFQRYCGYTNIEDSNRYITAYNKNYFAKDPSSNPEIFASLEKKDDGWIVICPDKNYPDVKQSLSTTPGGCYSGNNQMEDAVYLGSEVAPSKYKIIVNDLWYNNLKQVIPNINDFVN